MTARGGARDRALATTTRAAAEVGASAAMVRFVCASRHLHAGWPLRPWLGGSGRALIGSDTPTGIYDSEASGVRSGSIRARDANRATMPRAFTLRTALVVALACIASCPTPARALFDDLGDVVKLDAKNFDSRVTNAKEDVYWLVKYYAPWCGHCKKLAPEWTKAAKALKKEVGDKAKLGAVDCDDATNKALCAKFNVNGFPTLKGFASRGKESHDFDGARDADGIVQFVKTKLAAKTTASEDKLAPKLTYHDAFNFLNVVDAQIPKALLVSSASTSDDASAGVPSWWTSTAVKYKSGRRKDVAFAWVRHEDDPGVARNFKLDPLVDLPAVLFVAPNAEYHAFLRPAELGDRAGGKIRAAKAFVVKGRDGSLKTGGADVYVGVPKFPEPRKPRKTADARYAALTDENVLTDCFGSYSGTCVVLVVDANGVDEFPENTLMMELAKKYRNDPFSFVWIDGGAQAEFAKAFGVKKSRAPALVAVKSGRRNRFATLTAASAGDGLDERTASAFLDKILGGDMQFKPIASLPSVEPDYLRGDAATTWGDEEDDDGSGGVEVHVGEDVGGEDDGDAPSMVDIDALLDVDDGAVAAAPDVSDVEDE